MKIIYFATYYDKYLQSFYSKINLNGKTYQEIYDLLLNDNFGVFGQYAKNASLLGHNAIVLIANCYPLQKQWAKENNIVFNEKNWQYVISLEQIKKYKPDVFFIGSMFQYYGTFLDDIKPYCKNLMAWTSCTIPSDTSFDKFSLVLTSVPNLVTKFRSHYKVNSELLLPSFDKKIYNTLKNNLKRNIKFSFIGGLSEGHRERYSLLYELSKKTKIELFGYNYPNPMIPKWKRLLKKYPIIDSYRGEKWGMEMYETLGNSLISFNSHIDIAENYAGNMRMFEATGMGSLLLTDYKDNLHEIFEIDKEVIGYRSIDEAIDKVKYLLKNRKKLDKIAKAGQQRTFSSHSFEGATKKMLEYFKGYMKA